MIIDYHNSVDKGLRSKSFLRVKLESTKTLSEVMVMVFTEIPRS